MLLGTGLGVVVIVVLTAVGGGGGLAVATASASRRRSRPPPRTPRTSAPPAPPTTAAGSPATYNLAFVIAGGSGCTPKWNGTTAIGDSAVKSRISALTESGGAVRVSFGGASGTELASTCDSASELAEAYGAALDAAGATEADFDVEGKR